MHAYTHNNWTIESVVDTDGHLTIWIKHKDRTDIHALDYDGSCEGWSERFTTVGIEQTYKAEKRE